MCCIGLFKWISCTYRKLSTISFCLVKSDLLEKWVNHNDKIPRKKFSSMSQTFWWKIYFERIMKQNEFSFISNSNNPFRKKLENRVHCRLQQNLESVLNSDGFFSTRWIKKFSFNWLGLICLNKTQTQIQLTGILCVSNMLTLQKNPISSDLHILTTGHHGFIPLWDQGDRFLIFRRST